MRRCLPAMGRMTHSKAGHLDCSPADRRQVSHIGPEQPLELLIFSDGTDQKQRKRIGKWQNSEILYAEFSYLFPLSAVFQFSNLRSVVYSLLLFTFYYYHYYSPILFTVSYCLVLSGTIITIILLFPRLPYFTPLSPPDLHFLHPEILINSHNITFDPKYFTDLSARFNFFKFFF